MVFRLPKDDSTDYIKRVIGLPGDRIRMIDGLLHINGQPVKRERIEDYIETEETERATRVKRWRETLPNGVSYTTLDLIDNGFYDNTQEYVVPAGHYFMMGDNRDNSTDSRVLSQVGYVPFQNLVGRAQLIFFSARRRRARVAGLALAVDRSAGAGCSRSCDEPQGRNKSACRGRGAARAALESASAPKAPTAASVRRLRLPKAAEIRAPGVAATACLRRPSAIAFPIRILLERALTHISALKGARPRLELSAARVSRRSRPWPCDFRNAVRGLSESR